MSDRIEVLLAEGGTGMLHHYANRLGHTAFLIGGISTPQDELARVRRAMTPSLDGSIIETVIALAVNSGVSGMDAYLEPAVAEKLGVGNIMLLVVRADGHVGLRADSRHADALAAYIMLLRASRV